MTKSLGPFDYNVPPKPHAQKDMRKRTAIGWMFDMLFPLVVCAVAFLVGRVVF